MDQLQRNPGGFSGTATRAPEASCGVTVHFGSAAIPRPPTTISIMVSVRGTFDGLLGQDILRQFTSVRINYRTHLIELEK